MLQIWCCQCRGPFVVLLTGGSAGQLVSSSSVLLGQSSRASSGAVADLANVYSRVQAAATVKVEVTSQNGLLACQHIDLYLGAGRPEGGVVQ